MVRLLQSRCRQTLSNVHLLLFTMPLSSIRLQQLTKLTKHVNSLFDCKPNQLFKFFSIFWLKIIFLKRKTKKKQQKTEIYVHVALSQIFPEIFRSLETFQAIVFFSYFLLRGENTWCFINSDSVFGSLLAKCKTLPCSSKF